MSHHRAFRAVGMLFVLSAACGSIEDEVAIIFPDDGLSREHTSAIAVTAFEPLRLPSEEQGQPSIVRCEDVGVFHPTHVIDPDVIGALPDLGNVLSKVRQDQPYLNRDSAGQKTPFDWSIEIPAIQEDSPHNPWGAVLVHLEARGDARASELDGGGPVTATLLSGCFCMSTREGTHPDRDLDVAVKGACPLIQNTIGETREIELTSVVSVAFGLRVQGVDSLTAPREGLVSPGPTVRITVRRCDDPSQVGSGECYDCDGLCEPLGDLSDVPILFTKIEGDVQILTPIVLTDAAGLANADLRVGACDGPIRLQAEIVGRADTRMEYTVNCVDPIEQFMCLSETRLDMTHEAISMTRVPGRVGAGGIREPDQVAILYNHGNNALLEVRSPTKSTYTYRLPEFIDETPRAVFGFIYDLDDPTAPSAVAVLTSKIMQQKESAILRLYHWEDSRLVSDLGAGSDESCQRCACAGTCDANTCELVVAFQTEVSMVANDLDNDGLADLSIGTSSGLAITTYFSSLKGAERLYAIQGCSCARYAHSPTSFELVSFGDLGQPRYTDVVIGAPGGSFVKYGQAVPTSSATPGGEAVTCGQPSRFGELVPVRDLARGNFTCNQSPCVLDDVVIVAAKSLGGGSFDDPGTIRVVYGSDRDLSAQQGLFDQVGTHISLTPMTLEGEEEPKDPRTVEVGDLNADGIDDVAVLFGASEEIHVWVGGGSKGLGEIQRGINLETCGDSIDQNCTPLRQFVLGDFDGDGSREVAMICEPSADPRLRHYSPNIVP